MFTAWTRPTGQTRHMPPLQQRLPRRTLQDLSSVTAVHTFNQHWPGTARPQTPRRTTTSQAVHLQGTLNAIVTTRTATRTSSHLPNPAPKYRQGLRLLPFHMGPRDLAPPAVSCKRRRLKRRPLRIPCSLRKRLRAPRMLQGLRRPIYPSTGPACRLLGLPCAHVTTIRRGRLQVGQQRPPPTSLSRRQRPRPGAGTQTTQGIPGDQGQGRCAPQRHSHRRHCAR